MCTYKKVNNLLLYVLITFTTIRAFHALTQGQDSAMDMKAFGFFCDFQTSRDIKKS